MKMNAFFPDLTQICKGKYLEPAGVRQNRLVPFHKSVKPAQLLNNFITWAYMKMIRIGKLHLCLNCLKIICGNGALNGCRGAHIHKYRSLYRSVNRMKTAPLSKTVPF